MLQALGGLNIVMMQLHTALLCDEDIRKACMVCGWSECHHVLPVRDVFVVKEVFPVEQIIY